MSFVRFGVYNPENGTYLKQVRGKLLCLDHPEQRILYEHASQARKLIDTSYGEFEVVKFVYVPVAQFPFKEEVKGYYDGYSMGHMIDNEVNVLLDSRCKDYPKEYEFLPNDDTIPQIRHKYYLRFFPTEERLRNFQKEREKALNGLSFAEYKKNFYSGYSNEFIQMCKRQFDPDNLVILGLKLEKEQEAV